MGIWAFECHKGCVLAVFNWVEQGDELNLLKMEPELQELCWSVKLKANLNIFKEIFQLNIDKALTCSSKYFKLKAAVLLSSAPRWPWFILSLELQMRIWAEWWTGLETAILFNFYLPFPDWFFDADMGSVCVLCVQCTLMYIHIYGITFRNSNLSSFLVKSYSFPQNFLVSLIYHFPRDVS